MKFVAVLSEAECKTLREAFRAGPHVRMRQRAHAVYLSSRGYRLEQVAEIFEVDRDTVSGWLDGWESQGLRGLYDAPRPGRPLIYSAAEQQQWRVWVEEEPRQLKQAQARLLAQTGKRASTKTLQRLLKKSTATAGSGLGGH